MAGQLVQRGKRDLERPYGPSAVKASDNSGTVVMEDARILFRNFVGRESQFNRQGARNFCVIIEPEIAEAMMEDDWNIKQLKSREDGVPGDYYLQVAVGFGKGRPPRLVLISSRGRVDLTEDECEILDWVEIKNVDLIIRPYHYDVNGSKGVKAYLKSLFITMNEDYLELKYSQVPMAELEGGEPLAIESGQDPDEGDIVEAEWSED